MGRGGEGERGRGGEGESGGVGASAPLSLPFRPLAQELPSPIAESPLAHSPTRPLAVAGVSSFGFSGTNAHLVLEEAPRAHPQASSGTGGEGASATAQAHLLTLSAKTEKALFTLAARYKVHLSAHPELDLADVCFTANIGRSHFDHRLSVVADSLSSMIEKLAAVANGQEASGVSGVFKGQACPESPKDRERSIDEPNHEGEPQVDKARGIAPRTLGELYVRGASIDWLDFYRGYQHQKVVLPTYPWDRKRYWVRRDFTSHYKITKVVTTLTTTDKTERGWLLSQLTATPPNERQALLMETILRELANVLELDKELDEASTIKEHEWLADLGIDSLMALEFTERIEFCLECEFDETLLFDYPTPKALADYLLSVSMPGHAEND